MIQLLISLILFQVPEKVNLNTWDIVNHNPSNWNYSKLMNGLVVLDWAASPYWSMLDCFEYKLEATPRTPQNHLG